MSEEPTAPELVIRWNVPDEEVVDAVRAHAGDRWVEELGPIDRP